MTTLLGMLRNNLAYKLISLGLGLVLWVYVQNVENPVITRPFEATPALTEVPDQLSPLWRPQTVTVILRDRKDMISRMRDPDLVASLSLRGATEGERAYPVTITFSPNSPLMDREKIEKIEPSRLTVRLEAIEIKPRRVVIEAEPPRGTQWVETMIEPAEVMVKGPRSLLRRVSVVARVDKRNSSVPATQEFREKVRVGFENPEGQAMEKLEAVPQEVEFRGRVESQAKAFPVHVSLMGNPQPGYRLRGPIIAEPSTVMVSGSQEMLGVLDSIKTEDVDITGASRTIERTVRLRVPPGLKLRAASRAKVTVIIEHDPTAGNTLPGPAPGR